MSQAALVALAQASQAKFRATSSVPQESLTPKMTPTPVHNGAAGCREWSVKP